MTERVPRNGVPTFCQKERNGTIKNERNEERNGVPAIGGTRERGIFLEILGKIEQKLGKMVQNQQILGKLGLKFEILEHF